MQYLSLVRYRCCISRRFSHFNFNERFFKRKYSVKETNLSKGKDKDIIFFTPALGIPGTTYKPFFELLEKQYNFHVEYLNIYGCKNSGPVQPIERIKNWDPIINDVTEKIENVIKEKQKHQCEVRVLGIGHSFGGCVQRVISLRKPHLFKGLIMIDSPMFHPGKRLAISTAKTFGLITKLVSVVRAVKNRQQIFASIDEMKANLSTKKTYSDWDKECFEEYMKSGTKTMEDGSVTYAFPQETELNIYKAMPGIQIPFASDPYVYTRKEINEVPTQFLYQSLHLKNTFLDRWDVSYLQNLLNDINFVVLPDEKRHYWPVVDPGGAAFYISEFNKK